MKKTHVWARAALAVVLAGPVAGWANGQAASPLRTGSNRMSAADRAVLQAHKRDLAEAARIYGYDLAAGGWSFVRTPCATMPGTMLLRYHRTFRGGSESVFVATVPRAEGRVRIVPVLRHNATPFVPAPTDPRNVALFNQLVPKGISREGTSATGNWVERSACYAELTGGRGNRDSGSVSGFGRKAGIDGVPAPTLYLEPQGRVLRVTLATRESANAYKLWNLSFDQSGRVTHVATEDQPVYAAETAPPLVERGWKFIPMAPDPPSKVMPPAPEPQEITTPQL